jgi:O-antigen/teichoic acid export membrane protein
LEQEGGKIFEKEVGLVSKTIEMAETSAKGSLNLFLGLVCSTIVSALGVIFLARLLSPSEYGIVSIALIAPHFIAMFTDWGINSAIIKFTAQYRNEEKAIHVKKILAAGFVFQVSIGILLLVICFLLSGFFAVKIFQRPDLEPLIQMASFSVFAGVLIMASQSAFTGYERMELYGITLVLQSILKAFLPPVLVLIGLSAFGAVLGETVAFLGSGCIGIIIFYLTLYRRLPNITVKMPKTVQTIKTMLSYGLPLSISLLLSGFLLQFLNFLIAIYCADATIGNYNVAINFSVLITFFVTPITTVLFPVFSKLDPEKEGKSLKNIFRFSVKYGGFLVAPAAAALIALAEPAITTLFGQQYSEAPLYLAFYFLTYLLSVFGSLSILNLLNGLGKTRVTLKLTMVNLTTGFPVGLLLIPSFGVLGMITATLAAGMADLAVGLWWIRKHYTLTIDLIAALKILLSSAIAAATTYLSVFLLSLPSWVELSIGGIIFLVTYVTISPLIGSLTKTETQNLKRMLSGFGFISKILMIPLNYLEKLSSLE